MKRFYVHVLLLAMMGMAGQLLAQEQRTIRIKAEKKVNGEVMAIDTTIVADGDVDMQALMQELGLEGPHEAHEGQQKVKVIKMGEGDKNTFFFREGKEGEAEELHEEQRDVQVNVTVGDDGEEQIRIKVNGEEVDPENIDGHIYLHKDGGQLHRQHGTWTDTEGNVTKFEGKDGENVFFFKEGSEKESEKHITVDVNVEGGEGEGEQVVKVIEVEVHCIIEEVAQKDAEMLRKAGVSVDNSLTLSDLNFYPNPNDGRFNLDFRTPDTGSLQVRIIDLQGKTIYQESLPAFEGKYQNKIDISDQPDGIYFLSVSQNGQVANKKIVIE